MNLADQLMVSVTAAAIRYCDLDIESASVIMSKDGKVLFHISSYGMRHHGYSYIAKGSMVPPTSVAFRLLEDQSIERDEEEIDAEVWYEDKSGILWEESARLGNSGLIITYLTPQVEEEDEESETEDD